MAKPSARIDDKTDGTCYHPSHNTPIQTKGRIITGSPDTEINGKLVARVGDCVETDCGHKDYIITGSGTVEVNGKLEARVDDQVGRDGIYKARIITGSPDTEHNE